MPAGRGRRLAAVRSWPVWALPPPLLHSVLTVEATAVALVVVLTVVLGAPAGPEWRTAGLLALLGVLHTEIVVGTERIRRRTIADVPHVGLTSVWTFAGAVVLPPLAVAVVAVVVQTHAWARTGRPRVAAYRTVFSTATVVHACLAAHGVVVGLTGADVAVPGLLVLVLALLVYTTVNSALVGGAVAMSSAQPTLTTFVGRWDDNVLELATLSLGALVAAALPTSPWLVPLVLPPLLVLHRAVLVRHLEAAASTDAKTGLLNAATWHTRAAAALGRAAGAPRAVLVLDLDHFKAVNDTHGHLVGDQVLAAVADAVRAEVRDGDLVGRFGGEEFVVLLPGRVGAHALPAVAERLRLAVAALAVPVLTCEGATTIAGLTVSVGAARVPADGASLDAALQVADACLYAAKRGGRNLVRVAAPAWVPAPRQPSGLGRATL